MCWSVPSEEMSNKCFKRSWESECLLNKKPTVYQTEINV